ncbi:hypothetical protein A3A38_00145 [Candidatus Kaiserbacteria bacterium RIFCSPLOWO2_01_FULL_53_17]|uniref:Polymerase beta nucleotidyltransferase domain-containing protein n=1 Tax=Candidatus Kaiserbacteria bacterium RIFCSPLOWO2_01_FULL_53_17 TaxID=1798511 RepID=A0A1F6EG55_9BACT|nr:MAG: hypothetical protein A3A38_00145 [Candidatus Kaiserbacteria bacterium RIFCSPLOWO2_01_FULL_53_17]
MTAHGSQISEKQRLELKKLGVVLLYLHGSVAAGTAREDSDADIAVLFELTPKDPIQATTAILEALRGLIPGRELDIAILNGASPLLKQIVASRGKLLYARSPEDALRFELRAMHEYEYSRHVVRLGQELVLKRAGL